MRKMLASLAAILLLTAGATGQWRTWQAFGRGGGCGDPSAGPWGVMSETERTGTPGAYRYRPVVWGPCPCDVPGQIGVVMISFGTIHGVTLMPNLCPDLDPTWGAFILGTCTAPLISGNGNPVEWWIHPGTSRAWGGIRGYAQAIVFDGTGVLRTTESWWFEFPRVDW